MTLTRSGIGGWRPAVFAAAILFALGTAAHGQQPPKPDRPETARLVWSTLIAVDHANRTGNYSVLRDLGAPGFQQTNDAARLAQIFARVREADLGIGRAVLYAPEYTEPPRILDNGLYRIRGVIPMRPEGLLFDMLFQYVRGEWRLMGVSVAPEEPEVIEGDDTPQPRPETSE